MLVHACENYYGADGSTMDNPLSMMSTELRDVPDSYLLAHFMESDIYYRSKYTYRIINPINGRLHLPELLDFMSDHILSPWR